MTILDPLGPGQGLAFWAVAVAAAVVSNALELTLIALFDVAAQSRSAAAFDSAHDAQLGMRQGSGMLLAIGLAIAPKHVCHFQPGAVHRARRSEVLWWSRFRLQGKGPG